MIFLLLPALLTWFLLRRVTHRWARLLVLLFSPVLLAITAEIYALVSVDHLPPVFIYAYAAVIFALGGVLLFAPPRRRPHECHGCGYDLRGIEGEDQCPECGGETPGGRARRHLAIRAKRRAVQAEHARAVLEARERLIEQPAEQR
ncbi:MAG: hypothetical protein AAGI30_03345 [Planctomycetota bacterium]